MMTTATLRPINQNTKLIISFVDVFTSMVDKTTKSEVSSLDLSDDFIIATYIII